MKMTLDFKDDEFITTAELAERWRVHPDSVIRWRMKGKPQAFYSINGKILYKVAEIEELELAKRQNSKLTT